MDPADDDNFGEDECTIEFGDEEPTSNSPDLSSPYLRPTEFEGEDYSKYLQDDDDNSTAPVPASPVQTRRRYVKHNQGLRKSRPVSPPPPKEKPVELPYMPEIPAPDYDVPSPDARRKSTGTIRNRLGRLFTTLGSGRSKRGRLQENSGPSSLHDFTFADSKLGLLIAAQHQQARKSSPDNLETASDLAGYTARRQSWWDVGTLSSARSIPLSDHSSIESSRSRRRQRKKSSSVPNLKDNCEEVGSVLSSASSTSRKQSSNSDRTQPQNSDVKTDSALRAPTPPPLRSTSSRGGGEGAKLTGFLKRLTDGIPRTSNRRSRSEIADQSPVVNQPRYSRTYEEIPVRL